MEGREKERNGERGAEVVIVPRLDGCKAK